MHEKYKDIQEAISNNIKDYIKKKAKPIFDSDSTIVLLYFKYHEVKVARKAFEESHYWGIIDPETGIKYNRDSLNIYLNYDKTLDEFSVKEESRATYELLLDFNNFLEDFDILLDFIFESSYKLIVTKNDIYVERWITTINTSFNSST